MHPNQTFYQNYSEEQFAADEFFQQWVLSPDREKERFWDIYLQLYPHQKRALLAGRDQVKDLAQTGHFKRPLSGAEKKAMKEELFRYLELNALPIPSISSSKILPLPGRRPLRWVAAAAVLGLAFLSVWMFAGPGKSSAVSMKKEAFLSEQTNAREIKRLVLADSSVVILNPNSSLRYASDFSTEGDRDVYLRGNAYFLIKKSSAQNLFVVHTQALSVSVLGTQFNVDARSAATEVALTGGKVKVTMRANERNESILQPGEKLSMDTVHQVLIKTLMDTRLYSAWTEQKWNFLQTPLTEITTLIHEYYGVDAVFLNPKSAQLKISAVIQVSSLHSLVEVLEKTLQIQITETNNHLLIH